MQSQLHVFLLLPISIRTELRYINTSWLPCTVQNDRHRSPFFRDEFRQDNRHFIGWKFGEWQSWMSTCYRQRQNIGTQVGSVGLCSINRALCFWVSPMKPWHLCSKLCSTGGIKLKLCWTKMTLLPHLHRVVPINKHSYYFNFHRNVRQQLFSLTFREQVPTMQEQARKPSIKR